MSWSSDRQGGGGGDADSLTAVGAGSAVLFCGCGHCLVLSGRRCLYCPISNIIVGLQPWPFNALMLLVMVSIEKQDGYCLCLA